MESSNRGESIAEVVERITAAAHRGGLSVDIRSRSDTLAVVEILGSGRRHRCGIIIVKRGRSGSIHVYREGVSKPSSTASKILAAIAVLSLLTALYCAIEAGGMCAGDDYDMACDVARGMAEGVSGFFAVLGVLILALLAWIWRPSRRRCLETLDALVDDAKEGSLP